MLTFATVTEAEAAGFRRVGRTDHDASRETVQPGAQGYDYRADDGSRSVTVFLTAARNAIGAMGAYLQMFAIGKATA